jgi:hypothetical protein
MFTWYWLADVCAAEGILRPVVMCAHQSAGKTSGTGGAKMGNVHVKWAFSEAAVLFLRHAPGGQKLRAAVEKRHGKGKALSILAHKIGRAVLYMLARGTVFSMDKFRGACRAVDREPKVREPARLMGRPLSVRPRVPGGCCPFPEPGDDGRAPATSPVMRRPARGPE